MKLRPVRINEAKITDTFWKPRIDRNREVTLPTEYELLKKTGRLTAFNLKTEQVHKFWDSDNAKWIEAAAYSLAQTPDPELERQVDEYVRLLVSAQAEDGYLNSYFQTKAMDKRWTNLRDDHELYCAGHLMEAAVAYAEQCGKIDLLQALCRYADHIAATFGAESGKKRGYCGHPEIELALVRLYRATGEQRYLDLARFFVEARGETPNYFADEAKLRGETEQPHYGAEYYQAHQPLREQTAAEGHAVRAAYLYAGLADVAAETRDESLLAACRQLWQNMVTRRMYVTGGIGSEPSGERFTCDYDLPNDNAYAETCAAIALVFFASRMLNLELNAEYADVMERALYNGVLSGVSLDGTKFFYANRLEVHPTAIECRKGFHSFPPSRQEWFGCACCPPNIARLLASLQTYAASVTPEEESGTATFALHLYMNGEMSFPADGQNITLRIVTEYPWQETVRICVEPENGSANFALLLRLPGWCRSPKLTVNGNAMDVKSCTKQGYAAITQTWNKGDMVELTLPMPVEQLEAHPSVRQDAGCVALQRGPLVYCLEQCDNGADLADLALSSRSLLTALWEPEQLGGFMAITGKGTRRRRDGWDNALYRPVVSVEEEVTLRAVPYALWDNRTPGEMRVWLRRRA